MTTSNTITSTYTVTGMTCGHCVGAVSSEVGEVAGVTNVEVDLQSGKVTVTSDREIAPELIRAAVEEAGYEVAG